MLRDAVSMVLSLASITVEVKSQGCSIRLHKTRPSTSLLGYGTMEAADSCNPNL